MNAHFHLPIGAALLALIAATAGAAALRAYGRPRCLGCDGAEIDEDPFGRCVCRNCGREWNSIKRFGSAHADL